MIRYSSSFLFLNTAYLFLVCLTQILWGQDSKPLIEVNSAVDTSVITIGDRITYTITIDHIAGMRVEQPGAGVNLGQFEIKDYTIYDPEQQDNRIFLKYEYVISVFDTGSFTIPPFPIAYFPTDSISDYKIIEASPINIYVQSVINDEKRELRDIKPPLTIPYDYFSLFSIIAAVILLGVIVYLGYMFYKRKKEKGYLLRPPEPSKPAHEVALQALEALMAKELIEKGAIKQFYSELSEIVRRYIENRFFVPALEETSTEILVEMRRQDLNGNSYDKLQNLLRISDLVKFAKFRPEDKEHENATAWAKDFVLETQIQYQSDNLETLPQAS
jgi:hypothetical protein